MPLNEASPFIFIVIDNTTDHHCREVVETISFDDRIARLAGTDDHDRNAVFAVLQFVRGCGKTVENGWQTKRSAGRRNTENNSCPELLFLHSEQVNPFRAVDRTRHKTCHHKVLKLCLACKCPQAVIETEQIKYEQCDNNPDGQKWRIGSKKRCRYCTHVKIIPDQDRQIAGGDYTDNIVYN